MNPRKRLDRQVAPDFTLDDLQGNSVHFSDYLGRKHVVLVFTRGLY